MSVTLSVVLCTWNNSARLRTTLEAIELCANDRVGQWELVLVNNASTDDTERVARQFEGRLPLKYVHEPRQGLSFARNAGIENAAAPWIIFTDDDVRPCESWLLEYQTAIDQNQHQRHFFGGAIRSEFEATPPAQDLLDVATPCISGFAPELDTGAHPNMPSFLSANWAAPRAAVVKLGGFDTKLGLNPLKAKTGVGEETDLMRRLKADGYIPYYLPNAYVYHWVPKQKATVRHIADRIRATGRHQLVEKQNDTGATIFGVPRWLYVVICREFLRWSFSVIRRRPNYRARMRLAWFRGVLDRHLA